MIANSLFVYFAVIIQLYLFLCYKMNDFNSKVKRNSVIKVNKTLKIMYIFLPTYLGLCLDWKHFIGSNSNIQGKCLYL